MPTHRADKDSMLNVCDPGAEVHKRDGCGQAGEIKLGWRLCLDLPMRGPNVSLDDSSVPANVRTDQ